MKKTQFPSNMLLTALLSTLLMTACSDNDDPAPTEPETVTYRVTVTNLSANQPLSPIGVVLHDGTHQFWRSGQPASTELEHLAEGGNNTPWLTAADTAGFVTQTGAAPVGPGQQAVLDISSNHSDLHFLTIAGMLVNTNDAFSGAQGIDVEHLQSDDVMASVAPIYDAGSEANTEAAATLPGPAGSGSGVGYSSVRDDQLNAVRIHAGVIGADDGLAGSALSVAYRFDNPGMRIQITRM